MHKTGHYIKPTIPAITVFAFPLNNRLMGAILSACKLLCSPRFWVYLRLPPLSMLKTGQLIATMDNAPP